MNIPKPEELVAAVHTSRHVGRFSALAREAAVFYEKVRVWCVEQREQKRSELFIAAKLNDFVYVFNDSLRVAAKLLDEEVVKTPFGPAKLATCHGCGCPMGVHVVNARDFTNCADCRVKGEESFRVGQRVFNKESDLFGSIVSINAGQVKVKYEWPISDKSLPADVPISHLLDARSVG